MEPDRALAVRFASDFPADAARRLDAAPASEVAELVTDLAPEAAARVIGSMLPGRAAAALERLAPDRLAAVTGRLTPVRLVLVLRAAAEGPRRHLVESLHRELRVQVERLLRTTPGTAGALAEPVPATVTPRMNAADASSVVRDATGPYAFVVDADHRLVGVAHRRELVAGDQRTLVAEIMVRDVIRLPAATPRTAIAKHPAWSHLDPLPVVGPDGVLVGVIRHKTVRGLGAAPPAPIGGRQPAVGAFLELGELYWGGLTSLVTALAFRVGPGPATEVDHGS